MVPPQEDDMAAPLTPAQIAELTRVADLAAQAGHGGKGEVYAKACERLGWSLAKLHRGLNQVAVRPLRKRRSDAGEHELLREDATVIHAFMRDHYRGNGKRGITLRQALKDLRANGLVKAEGVNAATGEIAPLTESAVAAALRTYGLHWEQMHQPTVAMAQSTPHPNHTWQMDASVCTLFYMDTDGTSDMPEQVFYKNKPENFERVQKQRVTRFVMSDHTSGAIKLRYYLGGESVANFTEFFLWCIQSHGGDHEVMYGVPFQLMVDPGSGMKGAFPTFARRMAVELIVNAPGNPRAKGQVENAQNLAEMGYEHQFRAQRPASMAELNAGAEVWAAHFNATERHRRHGTTRAMKWMEISQAQLRIAPPIAQCRELLTAEPKLCKVDVYGNVQFGGGGRQWNVRGLPGGRGKGDTVAITYNPYNDREVFAVLTDANGHEVLHACPLVEKDQHGFATDARVIGQGYQALPDTAADRLRKHADLVATGATTQEAAAKARKQKGFETMGGQVRFDHLKTELAAQATLMPRRGTDLQPQATTPSAPVAPRVLNMVEVLQALARSMELVGQTLTREHSAHVQAQYPQGMPEDQLPALRERLLRREAMGLRVVNGGVQ